MIESAFRGPFPPVPRAGGLPHEPVPGQVSRLLGMPTLGEILDRRDGYGPGFDFLRLALAVSVVAFHTHLVAAGGSLTLDRYTWLLSFCVLPMFFALGGFLISGSAERIPVRHFLLNRAFRLFPALAVETLLSAVVSAPCSLPSRSAAISATATSTNIS